MRNTKELVRFVAKHCQLSDSILVATQTLQREPSQTIPMSMPSLSKIIDAFPFLSMSQQTTAGTPFFRVLSFCAILLLASLFIGCMQSSPSAPSSLPPPQAKIVRVDAAIAALSTEKLIDKLQEEAKQGAGTHTTAFVGGFLPLDMPARFGGGVIGSAAPAKSEVMVELVRRGVSSVPALLEHLEDARPTKLVIGGPDGFQFDATWFSDEYDYRFHAASHQPKGVNTVDGLKPDRMFTTYTIKVGDLCYVALGQIVNRRLLAARYQPSGCMVVNSPTQYPVLARAAREDWRDITTEGLEQSLIEDLTEKSAFWTSDGALEHLLFYFPSRGREAVERLFDRDVLDLNSLYDFALRELPHATTQGQKKLIADFRREHGANYWHGVYLILSRCSEDETPERAVERKVASELRSRLFSGQEPVEARALDIVDYETQQRLIDSLAAFQWDNLNSKLLTVFRRAVADIPLSVGGRIGRADLALSCARRIIHQGHDEEFAAFFATVIEQLKRDDAEAVSIQRQGLLGPGNAGYHPALSQRFSMYGEFLRQLKSD